MAVVFGGPSPEHDVSILTGLQVARTLLDGGREAFGLYWSKTGDWFRVPATLEAADFFDGVPGKAEALRLTLGSDGGFAESGGRLGKARPVPVDVAVICCHGGPGEDGALQAAFDLAGSALQRTGSGGRRPRMDKLAFAGLVEAAGLPACPGGSCHRPRPIPASRGPYIVKPRFGGSSLGSTSSRTSRRPGPGWRPTLTSARGPSSSPTGPISSTSTSPSGCGRRRPSRPSRNPSSRTTSAEILNYTDKYVGGEGMAWAPRELPAASVRHPDRRARGGRPRSPGWPRSGGWPGSTFLSDGDGLVRERGQHHPRVAGPLSLGRSPGPFLDLLGAMIDEAYARPTWRPNATGADGTVLRSAGGIAAKSGLVSHTPGGP